MSEELPAVIFKEAVPPSPPHATKPVTPANASTAAKVSTFIFINFPKIYYKYSQINATATPFIISLATRRVFTRKQTYLG